MPTYSVGFRRELIEVVEVEASCVEEAKELVYDSGGQDMEVCKSTYLDELDFQILSVKGSRVRFVL